MKILTQTLLHHPLIRRIGWVIYAIVFYLSGESFVIWLLEPENFTDGMRWPGVVAFPVLFIGFFFLQRHLGCAAGSCQIDPHRSNKPKHNDTSYTRPPGF